MLGSKNRLTGSGNAELDRRQKLTSAGMADWVDLTSDKHCASCRWFARRRCWLFIQQMHARGEKRNFRGPQLPIGQRACRRYEKAPRDGSGENDPSAASKGGFPMPSFSERYPRTGGTFLTAEALRNKPDLVAEISEVEIDAKIGNRYRDLVRFRANDYCLVLNQPIGYAIAALHGDRTEDWVGKFIACFCDETVEFEDDQGQAHKGGVRVRPFVPKVDGSAKPTAVTTAQPKKPDPFDDAMPF
jgi:hypothetical protein